MDALLTAYRFKSHDHDEDNYTLALTHALTHGLLNNPSVARKAIAALADPSVEHLIVKPLIAALNRLVQQRAESFDRDAVMRLLEVQDGAIRKGVFNDIIEPLFFKRPDLFDVETLRVLESAYANDVPACRYLSYYVRMHETGPPMPSEAFPHQVTFHALMDVGPKRVLVMHNLKDGMGDELIRNATLIQALLDFNPNLEVVLYTDRPYLYDHPRVEVRSIQHFSSAVLEGESYDMIVHHYDTGQRYNDTVEDQFQQYLRRHQSPVYIKTNKAHDRFTHELVLLNGLQVILPEYAGNVYVPTYRLCAELGLPFRYGTQIPRESLFTTLPDPGAENYWSDVAAHNAEGRPVAIFNGFGGENERKGYGRDLVGQARFKRALHDLIASGFFVIVMPNHQPWGTDSIAQRIVSQLNLWEQQFVLVAPSPQVNDRLPKYLVSRAQFVATVEGGMMHLAYNMGQQLIALQMPGSGPIAQWFPAGSSAFQSVAASGVHVERDLRQVFSGQASVGMEEPLKAMLAEEVVAGAVEVQGWARLSREQLRQLGVLDGREGIVVRVGGDGSDGLVVPWVYADAAFQEIETPLRRWPERWRTAMATDPAHFIAEASWLITGDFILANRARQDMTVEVLEAAIQATFLNGRPVTVLTDVATLPTIPLGAYRAWQSMDEHLPPVLDVTVRLWRYEDGFEYALVTWMA